MAFPLSKYIRIFVWKNPGHPNIFGYLFGQIFDIRIYSDICLVNSSEYIWIFVQTNSIIFAHCWRGTMRLNWKIFSLSKLLEIEPFKSYMEATTAGRVDQLWTKGDYSSHPQHLLRKVKSWPGLWLPCLLRRLI